MADNTTRVLNLTPFRLRGLEPFKPVDVPSGTHMFFDEAGGSLSGVQLGEPEGNLGQRQSEFIIVPELIMTRIVRSQFGMQGSMPYLAMNVQNNSGRFVNTYLVSSTDKTTQVQQGESIPPGKSQYFNVVQADVWYFRTTFTDELVAIVRIGGPPGFRTEFNPDNQILRLTLTDEFVRKWREYQSGPSREGLETKHPDGKPAPSFTPRRIIGEKRAATPSPDDHVFLTATVVSKELSEEAFNGRKNRVVRDVEIAGALLRWGGSNPTLADYYGADKDDIRSLTIYADRMEVADHLRFPRTNITIYARELAFISEVASIDTTPLENTVRARSEYLTTDPEDPRNANLPADKAIVQGVVELKPTYLARDGDKGELGGTITLHVGEVIDTTGNTSKKRFVCRGGKGQAAEAGGLKKYVQLEGYPATYGKSQTFTVEDVKHLLESNSCEHHRGDRWAWRSDYWRWPGGETWPNKMIYSTAEENPLNNGHAVAVKLLAYCDSVWSGPYLERGFLPSGKYDLWGGIGGVGYKDEPNPAPRPCNGRDAYPGGWPGDGGNGGTLTLFLERGEVPDSVCDVGPGEFGNPTDKVEGGKPPGPTPAHALTIKIVLHTAIESKREPELTSTEVTGKGGKPADGRKIVRKGEKAPDGYEGQDSTATSGSINHNKAGDLSWAHPNVVRAVLRYARTAYRNGFRDDAATALDPYYALIGPDGKPKSIDGSLRLALASVTAMRNNLICNLDYYGNPPGWVPRLDALSNLQILKAVRHTAYETFYFADKLLRDYDALDDAHAISQRASDALKKELDEAKKNLQIAYDKIPQSLKELGEVQDQLVPIMNDIKDLKAEAEKKTEGAVKAQRIYSASMKILGGIAKSLPVGQPFVGLAGSAFDAGSKIDWNAEDPLKTASSAIDSFTSDVTKVMTSQDKKDKVAKLLTKDLSKRGSEQNDLVTQLTRSLEDETKEPEKKAEAIERSWKDFKVEERTKLAAQVEEANSVVTGIDTLVKALDQKIEGLKKKTDAESKKDLAQSEQDKKECEEKKKTAQDTITKLNAEKDTLEEDKLKRLTDLAEYRRKQAETEEEARSLAEAAKPEIKKQADSLLKLAEERKNKLDNLKGRITEAKRTGEDQEKLRSRRAETVKDVMSNLEELGSGLSMIGNGIVSLATPLTPADPTWKRLAEQMLHDDPDLRNRGKQLEQKMREVLEIKRRKAEELFRWQQLASASIATITSNLGALTELSQQRQSIDQGLNPAVRGYLEETKERAKDILGESIYWFVKSYQYEFLDDVDDTFFNFDTWTEEIAKLEAVNAKKEWEGANKTPPADKTGNSSVPAGKVKACVLSEKDYKDVGDGVFKAETLKLGAALLKTRQSRGTKFKGEYKSCVLERPSTPAIRETDQGDRERLALTGDETLWQRVPAQSELPPKPKTWVENMLDHLLQKEELSFSFVSDFEKGSFDLYDARVIDVDLTAFEITTQDPNLSFTIRVVHSGRSVIAKRSADASREFFGFQTGRGDDPISWQWVYNHSATPQLSRSTTEDAVAENVKALFDKQLVENKFKDYNPGLFSDYMIKIIDLDENKRSKIEAINKVAMNVTISQA